MRASPVLLLFLFVACAPRNQGFRPPVSPEATRDDSGSPLPEPLSGRDPSSKTDLDFARQAKAPPDAKADQTGLATWYGGAFAGRKTANGERFDPTQLTAAHRTFPFGTWVEVRRVDTGRTVRVRITDRGPFGDSRRIIDLSKKAAEDLGIIRDGVVHVELRVVEGP